MECWSGLALMESQTTHWARSLCLQEQDHSLSLAKAEHARCRGEHCLLWQLSGSTRTPSNAAFCTSITAPSEKCTKYLVWLLGRRKELAASGTSDSCFFISKFNKQRQTADLLAHILTAREKSCSQPEGTCCFQRACS